MPPEPLVLGFDTSGPHCAAALLRGGRLLAAVEEAMATGQAERLMPMLEGLLAAAGAGWRDLTAIGVGTGPGNFSGLRIAVAAARGLALALGRPAVGVTGFEALAEGLSLPRLVALPGRGGETVVARVGPGGLEGSPRPLRGGTLPEDWAGTGLPVTGHEAHEAAALARATGGRAEAPALPRAHAIAAVAARRFMQAPGRPAPLYLRPADAAPPAEGPPPLLPEGA